MTVKNLSNTSFNELLDCFLKAFENYYVEMPTDENYYKKRWEAARVDFNLSYGMFDDGKLVGFIIHAIDKRAGILTAFNTGTGVLPEYRGKRIVRSIYEFALGDLLKNGIRKSRLEVIRKNDRAIRAYQAVGFEICKKYECYVGEIVIENPEQFELREIPMENVVWENLPQQKYYSWDFQKETVLAGNYSFMQVLNNDEPESFFIINTENNYLAQLDVLKTGSNAWKRLFSAIKQVSGSVKIINVDERLEDKINYIRFIGLKNSVNQYEMELDIRNSN